MTHGGDIYKYAKKLGCKPEEIIDFSSNINLYQPEFTFSLEAKTIARYPETNYTSLKESIAKKYALEQEQITLYGGATAGIYALFQELQAENVYLYAPLYGEYEQAARMAKKSVYLVNRIDELEEKVEKKAIVVFVNPSTPEGTHYELEALFSMWMKRKCTIILDESFLEFESLPSYRKMINEYEKLYIIQSFSKYYSCAGVRVGAIFSHQKSSAKLSQLPWNLSVLDTHFLQERLVDEDFHKQTQEYHLKQKEQLQNILEKSNLFDEVVQSDANFILCYAKRGEAIFEHLLEAKILVRKCGSFDYLNDNWLRFAVKSAEAHQKLEETLRAFS